MVPAALKTLALPEPIVWIGGAFPVVVVAVDGVTDTQLPLPISTVGRMEAGLDAAL
jgi:hypothetical protein